MPDTEVLIAGAGPTGLILALWLLPRIKGALIGLQWALRMHGFGGPANEESVELAPAALPGQARNR